ncbi:hypothetical protein INT47_002166 [Mucor saturninus]|uniref:Reverse transcriptase domain-containing protein n=1 Tax=Mucor saturninus TaxID=64648 RepID=A0A8H7USH8_9FUNG|nr:hypothetical protein INT47_002166 [Mucor saturninus]
MHIKCLYLLKYDTQKAAEDLYQKTNSLICSVPVTLGGHKIMALVDSGATTSIVSPSFLLKNKISFLPDKKIYKLAARGTNVTRLGITSPLTLVHNGITITHSFDVFELSYDHITVFIGSDLMNKVGIYLSGLATSWSGTNRPTNPDPILNKIDQPNNSPFGTKAEYESFMAAIQPLLKANARIPITSLCTVPEFVIRLDTPPGKIAYRSQYPIPVTLLPVLREQVKSWLRDEVIGVAPVNTAWNSPITFAPKKGADRVTFSEKCPCLDTRHLNLLLEDCRYPLPNIQEIFQKMSGAKVFTTLDLKAAFHRFKVFEEHKQKTAFTVEGKQYQFVGCPFGLKTISSIFQRVMHIIFHDADNIISFIDDVVVFSADLASHKKHVSDAITRLTKVNLVLNHQKGHYAQKSVHLLGFSVSAQGRHLDKRKISNAMSWGPLQNGKQVQSFLGLVNYFRDQLPNFSQITRPLDAL